MEASVPTERGLEKTQPCHRAGKEEACITQQAHKKADPEGWCRPKRGLPSSWMVFRPLCASGSAAGLLVWFIISSDLQSVRPSRPTLYFLFLQPLLAINSEPKEHAKTSWSGQTACTYWDPRFSCPRVSQLKLQRHHKAQKVLPCENMILLQDYHRYQSFYNVVSYQIKHGP